MRRVQFYHGLGFSLNEQSRLELAAGMGESRVTSFVMTFKQNLASQRHLSGFSLDVVVRV